MVPPQGQGDAVYQDGNLPVGGAPQTRLCFATRVFSDEHERHLT